MRTFLSSDFAGRVVADFFFTSGAGAETVFSDLRAAGVSIVRGFSFTRFVTASSDARLSEFFSRRGFRVGSSDASTGEASLGFVSPVDMESAELQV